MTALIVIPVFDEAATLGDVVRAARAVAPVLVVDDGSADGSAVVARRAGAEIIRHPRRLGKGQAIRTGIAAARTRGASLVVTLDGDGQHDPHDLDALLEAARATPRAIIVGSRLADAARLPVDRLNAIRVAGFFASWASGLELGDTQSGYRVYPLALFDDVGTRRGGFVFETEVLVAALARGWRVREVPIRMIPHATRRSRVRPFGDGAAIGVYLAGQVMARWAAEARAAGQELAAAVRADRRRARHSALLSPAAPFANAPVLWALAGGGSIVQRVGACAADFWRHARVRRAGVAARATLVAPLLLVLLLLQALGGRWLPDIVSPLVDRVCPPERLDAAGERVPAVVVPVGRRR